MKINFNEPHFLNMMQKLQNIITQRNLKPEEYFNFLIWKNKSTKDKNDNTEKVNVSLKFSE